MKTTPRRATLAQVAGLAGMSPKTASRALGGEPYVSNNTRTLVLAAAHTLDYQRNAAASLLASGRLPDSVGFIAGDFTNPFAVADGLENAIRERGIHLTAASSRQSADREWRLAQSLADLRTTAIVVVSAMADHSRYAALQARGIPVVVVDRPAGRLAADSVVLDDRAGGRTAAGHLLAAGQRRIGFIGDYDGLSTHRERVAQLSSPWLGSATASTSSRPHAPDDPHRPRVGRAAAVRR